jgi:putative flippase GtrA
LIGNRTGVARFCRFAIVGSVGFAIDAGLLALLHHGAGIDPLIARLASITASALSTWRLNRSLTFGASPRSQAAEGLRYGTVAAATAAFNYLLYALLLYLWPPVTPVGAAVVATLLAMGLSYAGYSRLVFGPSEAIAGPSSQSR